MVWFSRLQPGLNVGSRQHLKDYLPAEDSEDLTGSFFRTCVYVCLRVNYVGCAHLVFYMYIHTLPFLCVIVCHTCTY